MTELLELVLNSLPLKPNRLRHNPQPPVSIRKSSRHSLLWIMPILQSQQLKIMLIRLRMTYRLPNPPPNQPPPPTSTTNSPRPTNKPTTSQAKSPKPNPKPATPKPNCPNSKPSSTAPDRTSPPSKPAQTAITPKSKP
jgi:hypothetical protein